MRREINSVAPSFYVGGSLVCGSWCRELWGICRVTPLYRWCRFANGLYLAQLRSGLLQPWGGQIRSVRDKSERLRPSLNSDEEEL